MVKLGFLVSHRGSNMQAVIDACKTGRLPARPCVVISNNGDAEALQKARREGIPHYHLSANTHPDPVALDLAIRDALKRHGADWVVLAGYLKKVGAETLKGFHDRIINIHPALLPKYGGQGLYGLRVHEAVLRAGDEKTGITIHLVDAEYDRGRIVAQCEVPILPGDTPETLAQRVLAREHDFLVETLRKLILAERT